MIKLTVHIQYNPRQYLAYDRPLIFLSFHLLSLSEPSSPLQLWQLLHLDDAQIEIFNVGISQAPFLDLQLHGGHFSLTVYLLPNNSVSKINLMLFFLGKKKILRNIWEFFKKLNLKIPPQDPAISLLVIYPRELKINIHKKMYINVHSFIHNSPKLETTQCPSTDKWINK